MTLKTLQHLLASLRKEPCTKANEIYKTVVEMAMIVPDNSIYAPELQYLLTKYPCPENSEGN